MRQKIVVPYARNRIAYAIIKSLHHYADVYAADSVRIAMGRFSRYTAGTMVYPEDDVEFLQWCNSMINRDFIIFPTFTESWLLQDAGLINSTPNLHSIKLANDKLEVHKLCKMCDVPTPHTQLISQPSVVKPINGRGSVGRFYVDEGTVIQERVYGDAIGIGMIYNRGEPRAKFAWKRVAEYPNDGGTSIIRKSIREPKLERYAEKLLTTLRWHGVAMVEFKGEHVIEINPRFWGSLQLAIDSGVDFPKLLLDIITKGDCEHVTDWKLGVHTCWVAGCLRARIKPMGHAEDWDITDPLPFFTQFATVLANTIKGKGLVLDAT